MGVKAVGEKVPLLGIGGQMNRSQLMKEFRLPQQRDPGGAAGVVIPSSTNSLGVEAPRPGSQARRSLVERSDDRLEP
eukprot:5836922-Karenia_brevis.AAC.1